MGGEEGEEERGEAEEYRSERLLVLTSSLSLLGLRIFHGCILRGIGSRFSRLATERDVFIDLYIYLGFSIMPIEQGHTRRDSKTTPKSSSLSDSPS